MSGQVIAIPIVGVTIGSSLAPIAMQAIVAAIPIMGVVIAGSLAAIAIQAIVDKQVEAAKKKAEAERQQIREWEAFQVSHRQRLNEVCNLQNTFRQVEAKLSSIGLGAATQPSAWVHKTPVYAGAGQRMNLPDELLRQEIQNMGYLLRELPESFRLNPQSPFEKMKKWYEKIEASLAQPGLLRPEAVASFKDTLLRTFTAYIAKEEAESRKQEEILGQLNGLLNEVQLFRQLAATGKDRTDTDHLWHDLQTILSREVIPPGQVQHIVKRFGGIQKRVAVETARRANRQALGESLIRHFTAIGYRLMSTSPDPDGASFSEAVLAMPGGEQVRARMAPDGSLAFQLMHEAIQSVNTLSREAVEFYKQQETKWCADFKEIIRGMAAEGFVYNVKFEQKLPLEKIPVVVLETGDDLAQWREEEDELERFNREDRRRYLS
jgi:hypothetical protein